MDQTLVSRLNSVHSCVDRVGQQLEYERSLITRFENRLQVLEREKSDLIKAVGTLDRCIQIVSSNGIGKIESIVTDGLQRVFGKNIALVIEKRETARGNTYRLLIRKGDTVGNPMDSFGGGVQNVVAFLLRVILIKRFKLAPMLFLDEQFSNVSSEYQPQVSQMLKTLAGLGFTIFTNSHQDTITAAADKISEVVADEGFPPRIRKVENLNEFGGNFGPTSQQGTAQES